MRLPPSPSGAKQPVLRLIPDHYRDVGETVDSDLHGNLMLGINIPRRRRVMVAEHCDELGSLIKYCIDDGYRSPNSIRLRAARPETRPPHTSRPPTRLPGDGADGASAQ